MLSPLRVFIPGEIVAIEFKGNTTNDNVNMEQHLLANNNRDNNSNDKRNADDTASSLSRQNALNENELTNVKELSR